MGSSLARRSTNLGCNKLTGATLRAGPSGGVRRAPTALAYRSTSRGEWRHEFLNDERSITAKYVNDPFTTFFAIPSDRADRDFFALGAGLSTVLARGLAAFVSYETILGYRDLTYHEFWAGVRMQF